MKRIGPNALLLAAAIAIPSAAIAHHGWEWTEEKESRLSGTIEGITFGNPHMHLMVRNESGTWEVDLSPPSVASKSGFGPAAAKIGDKVSFTGHRSKDPKQLGFKAETVTVRGKTYDVYPQREKMLKPAA